MNFYKNKLYLKKQFQKNKFLIAKFFRQIYNFKNAVNSTQDLEKVTKIFY